MPHRRFVDDEGQVWHVWETYPRQTSELRQVAPEFAGGWLAFESAKEKRRLAPIPEGWETMSDAELGRLRSEATFIRERGESGVWPKFPEPPSA
jgi:hypothetical protein